MEEEEWGYREELHPLQNFLILEHIFDKCSVKTLKACREVSKLWLESSLKKWRLSVRVRTTISEPLRTVTDLVEFLVESEDFNLNSEEAENFILANNFCLDQNSKQFWKLCGSTVRILELCRISFRTVQKFRKVIYNCCPNMEQLTLLDIIVIRSDMSEKSLKEPEVFEKPKFGEQRNLRCLTIHHHRHRGVTWMEMLSHFPNLKTLTLKGTIPNLDGLLKSISIIRSKDPNKLQLTDLNTIGAYPFISISEHLCLLLDRNLHLESLSARANGENKAVCVRDIFNCHFKSLKKICFSGTFPNSLNPSCIFPLSTSKGTLENVREIELFSRVFENMTFLKFTPNLRKLVLREGCSEMLWSTDGSEMEDMTLEKCTELEVHGVMLGVNGLQKLINWLPNVKRLRMPLNNELFTLVCENWKRIKWLDVIWSLIDDSGITGLDAGEVERINFEGENCSQTPVNVLRSNITDLKDLVSFQLQQLKGNRLIEIGYCSAVYGIQQVPHLKYLQIENAKGELFNTLHSQFPWPDD